MTITLAVCLCHSEILMTTNAKYPVDQGRHEGVYSILPGSHISNQESLSVRQLPKQLVSFIHNDAFGSKYIKTSFSVKHHNINFVALYRNSKQVPAKLLHPDFENANCVRECAQLMQGSGKYVKDRELFIYCGEFVPGYVGSTPTLTPDPERAHHYSLIKTCNLRAEMHSALALPSTVNLIVGVGLTTCSKLTTEGTSCLIIREYEHCAVHMYFINGCFDLKWIS